ncbi:hypothetical protein QAD02_007414 [Eretmocerus hayati]|uniref:Uncharacterized protein n=1 Tax=Eretmocerus hayati TaxID=131215 RepID=A0ACC2N3X7_9HYME|nr:hypothetical protein QAD02_007414 [Eretmocerus hayati]
MRGAVSRQDHPRPCKAKQLARETIREQAASYKRHKRGVVTTLSTEANSSARTREFQGKRPPIFSHLITYSRSVAFSVYCQLMNVEVALVPEIPEEKLIELHYFKAVKLCEAFREVQNREPSIYFYHSAILQGNLNYLDYNGERLFYLLDAQGRICPDTFYKFPSESTTLVNLKKAAETIYASVYTHWRLWCDATNENYLDHFLISRIPNNLLKDCPITDIDLDKNILQYLRTLQFYRVYRELPAEISERIKVESFRANIRDSTYVTWRGPVLYFNHLSPRYESDTVVYPEFSANSLSP